MSDPKTIKIHTQDIVTTISISRPDVYNAFNELVIEELTEAFTAVGSNDSTRLVILTGEGSAFCAGADITWMQRMKDYSYAENIADAEKLFDLMNTIDTCPKPTIARVNGYALGGGTGLISCCDIAVASDKAQFMLSNIQYGLFPAVIAPFLLRKIGKGHARELFLTGERFNAEKAEKIGLVNRVAEDSALDTEVQKYVKKLLEAGPETLKMCKEMIHHIDPVEREKERKYHAEIIAFMRMNYEGQEGFSAFLEKRIPNWYKK